MQHLRAKLWILSSLLALGAMGCAQGAPADPPDSGAAARDAGAPADAGTTPADGGAVDGGDPRADGAADAGVAGDADPAADAGAVADAGAADVGAAADASAADASAADAALRLPPANAGFDYQLGGSYPPPAGVRVLARDRTAQPVPGLYNICYVNGFQIQPGEQAFWETNHPELMLSDAGGNLVVDTDWK